jgi:hypothetical protein
MADDATIQAYREAWASWMKQLDDVHRVFLDGERMTPDRMKGLLNREARAKARYDDARAKLLGIEENPAPPNAADPDVNPFR